MAKYKLSENASIFWDMGQELENQKLLSGEVKELRKTKAVAEAESFGHIIKVNDETPVLDYTAEAKKSESVDAGSEKEAPESEEVAAVESKKKK